MKHLVDIVEVLFFVIAKPICLEILLFCPNHSLIYQNLSSISVLSDHSFDVRNVWILVHKLREEFGNISPFLCSSIHYDFKFAI